MIPASLLERWRPRPLLKPLGSRCGERRAAARTTADRKRTPASESTDERGTIWRRHQDRGSPSVPPVFRPHVPLAKNESSGHEQGDSQVDPHKSADERDSVRSLTVGLPTIDLVLELQTLGVRGSRGTTGGLLLRHRIAESRRELGSEAAPGDASHEKGEPRQRLPSVLRLNGPYQSGMFIKSRSV